MNNAATTTCVHIDASNTECITTSPVLSNDGILTNFFLFLFLFLGIFWIIFSQFLGVRIKKDV